MTEKLKQKIKEEIIKLPKETQDAISHYDWGKITEEIGREFLLSESEINDFQVETSLILLGLCDPESYTKNIENNIGVSADIAKKIAEEVFQKIFLPIMNMIEISIRHSTGSKDPRWDQTIKFILSGGDYSNFL